MFSIDSARVPIWSHVKGTRAGTRAGARSRGLLVGVHHDPKHIITSVASPRELATSMFSVRRPSTSGANLGGYLGEHTQLGTLTFRVTGDAGQTSLTIDLGSLEADDGLAHEISNVGTKDGVIDIVGAVSASDLNCSGIVTVADALVVLKIHRRREICWPPWLQASEEHDQRRSGATSTQAAWLTPATRSRSCSTQPTSPEACWAGAMWR